jgi:hypothetical protein
MTLILPEGVCMIQGRLEQPYRCGSFFPFPFLCFFVYPGLVQCVFLFFSGCHEQHNFNAIDQPCRISHFRVRNLGAFSKQTNDRRLAEPAPLVRRPPPFLKQRSHRTLRSSTARPDSATTTGYSDAKIKQLGVLNMSLDCKGWARECIMSLDSGRRQIC